MKELYLSGDIGWEITAQDLQKEIGSNDEDLVIHINSRGGLAFEGVALHNLIKNHKGKTTAIINGLAASAASYFYQAFDTRKVYDTSVEMHHNPLMIAMGDHIALKKASLHLEKLAGSFITAYSKATGRNKKEIKAELDDETYLYGQEIVDAGFADELIESTNEGDKDEMILNAMMSMDSLKSKMQNEPELYKSDLEKATKLFAHDPVNSGNDKILKQGGSKVMTKEQLQAENPELYNSIKQIGKDEAMSNVRAHSKWYKADPDMVIKNMSEGKEFDMECISEYQAKASMSIKLDESVEESVEDIEPENKTDDVESSEKDQTSLLDLAMSFSTHKGVK